eukprot:m.704725 g.704725  ORF g.704725 m.704725 type:complete len:65 (+) comp58718_c0_seq6:712-906(+)
MTSLCASDTIAVGRIIGLRFFMPLYVSACVRVDGGENVRVAQTRSSSQCILTSQSRERDKMNDE